LEERWQQEAQQRARDRQAQAPVQNQRAEFVEQNLGQWIRDIEADERARMESPTERRTREQRERGGRGLVRPLTLYHEDGSLAECRSRTGTGLSVSALESDRDNVLTYQEDSSRNIHYASAQQPMVGAGT
jgi:hypothetical protein